MNSKQFRVIAVAIALTAMLLLSMLMVALVYAPATPPQHDDNWYKVVNGVLDSDYYNLYPFENKSLNIGFSKFGELIGSPPSTTPDQVPPATLAEWLGLEYDGIDPFCNPAVDITSWVNGWFLDVQYVDPSYTYPNNDKHIWAYALFADGTEYGYDWTIATDPLGAPHAGRKTNAYAETDPMKILYHGPRQLVAMLTTHIWDSSAKTVPVVDVIITLIFDKVEKQVVMFKDIKLTLPKMHLSGKMDVQFSQREEWDLGVDAPYSSYAHWYSGLQDERLATCYGSNWTLATNILRETLLMATGNGTTATFNFPSAKPIASGYEKVYVDDYPYGNPVFKQRGVHYDVNYGDGTSAHPGNITFKTGYIPADGTNPDKIYVYYKYVYKSTFPHVYDLAQIIDKDAYYVGYHAYWPTVSDYTVDAITEGVWQSPLREKNTADAVGSEPWFAPLLVGEWDFLLDHTDIPQYRCVSVIGLTDVHDAEDANMGVGYHNIIDREVMYQLTEVFNPWDLNDAVHKQESRWVYHDEYLAAKTTTIHLTDLTPNGLDDQIYYAVMSSEYESLGATSATWTGYFLKDSETYPAESKWVNEFEDGIDAHSKNWALILNGTVGYEMLKVTPIVGTPTSTAPLTLQFKDLVDFDFWYKMINGTYGPHIEFKVYQYANGTGKWANLQAHVENTNTGAGWKHYTLNTIGGFIGIYSEDQAFQVTGTDTGNPTGAFHSFEYWTSSNMSDYYVGSVGIQTQDGIVAYVDDLSVGYFNRTSGIRYERVYNMEEDKLVPSEWDQYCSSAERVLINNELVWRFPEYFWHYWVTGVRVPYYKINFENGTLTFWHYVSGVGYTLWELPVGTEIKVLYSTIEENEKGRYEWIVVGRDAASIDSVGAAMVSEYFDSTKDIDVWNGALDKQDSVYGPAVPYLFKQLRPGLLPAATAYRDATLGYNTGRTAFRDDWCTTVPIESSNIITVGGPCVNLASEYFNDFADAFFTLPECTPTAADQWKIMPLSCWSLNRLGQDGIVHSYKPTYNATTGAQKTGYGVISTYKDLDGTIGFIVWGWTGQDTYYTSWVLWNTILGEKLQSEPPCLTTLILKFDYTKHPTVSGFWKVAEALGTISEYNGPSILGIAQGKIHWDP